MGLKFWNKKDKDEPGDYNDKGKKGFGSKIIPGAKKFFIGKGDGEDGKVGGLIGGIKTGVVSVGGKVKNVAIGDKEGEINGLAGVGVNTFKGGAALVKGDTSAAGGHFKKVGKGLLDVGPATAALAINISSGKVLIDITKTAAFAATPEGPTKTYLRWCQKDKKNLVRLLKMDPNDLPAGAGEAIKLIEQANRLRAVADDPVGAAIDSSKLANTSLAQSDAAQVIVDKHGSGFHKKLYDDVVEKTKTQFNSPASTDNLLQHGGKLYKYLGGDRSKWSSYQEVTDAVTKRTNKADALLSDVASGFTPEKLKELFIDDLETYPLQEEDRTKLGLYFLAAVKKVYRENPGITFDPAFSDRIAEYVNEGTTFAVVSKTEFVAFYQKVYKYGGIWVNYKRKQAADGHTSQDFDDSQIQDDEECTSSDCATCELSEPTTEILGPDDLIYFQPTFDTIGGVRNVAINPFPGCCEEDDSTGQYDSEIEGCEDLWIIAEREPDQSSSSSSSIQSVDLLDDLMQDRGLMLELWEKGNKEETLVSFHFFEMVPQGCLRKVIPNDDEHKVTLYDDQGGTGPHSNPYVRWRPCGEVYIAFNVLGGTVLREWAVIGDEYEHPADVDMSKIRFKLTETE